MLSQNCGWLPAKMPRSGLQVCCALERTLGPQTFFRWNGAAFWGDAEKA
jgi:hypothetical protein